MKRGFYLVLAALVIFSANAFAQATAAGTIQGTVMDQSQAVIAGAEVTITKKATGETRSTVSDGSGNFRFNLLSADNYSIKVSKPGFASRIENVSLLVGQTATADATLTPGSTTEIIEVTDTAPLVDIAKTSVSQDITPSEVEQLPMVGRDVANLAYLAPGREGRGFVRSNQEPLRHSFGQRSWRQERQRNRQRHR